MRMSIERCGRETNHALVVGTGFCKCAHVMFDFDPVRDKPKPRCTETKGGGGRMCSHVLGAGHKGSHVYECGSGTVYDEAADAAMDEWLRTDPDAREGIKRFAAERKAQR